jgi:uncharacterized small protein (DUF1192 family)
MRRCGLPVDRTKSRESINTHYSSLMTVDSRALALHEARLRQLLREAEAAERDMIAAQWRHERASSRAIASTSLFHRRILRDVRLQAAPLGAHDWSSPMRAGALGLSSVTPPPFGSPVPVTTSTALSSSPSQLSPSAAAVVQRLQTRIAELHSEQQRLASKRWQRHDSQKAADAMAARRTLAVGRAAQRDMAVSELDRVALQNRVLHEEVMNAAQRTLIRETMRHAAQGRSLRNGSWS